MIDFHTHILFGVDDGATTLEDSIALLQHQIKQGYTEVYLTPHMISGSKQTASKDTIFHHFDLLQKEVTRLQLPIKLTLGSEIYYVDNLLSRIKKNEFIPLGNQPLYLVELPTSRKPKEMDEFLYNASVDNIQIILAHVERYLYFSLEEIASYRALGARIQVNQSSLDGKAGHTIKKRAKAIVKNRLADIIASDIHRL